MRTLSLLLLLALNAACGVGESAVITLVFPHGARSCGMGEVGVALADDETVMFYNPAGLGVVNEGYQCGSFSTFYERLLPAFGIRDLWHYAVDGIYQPRWRRRNWGGFGININYINMGVNAWYDELGRELGEARSWEGILSLSYGVPLIPERHYLGCSVKLGRSALAPGIGSGGEGTAPVLAFDLGYLWRFGHWFRLGLTATNMGPSVFYISAEDADPIPFELGGAIAFVDTFSVNGWPILNLALETRTHREFVQNYTDESPDPFYRAIYTDVKNNSAKGNWSEVQWHWGLELLFLETFAIRNGFLFDWVGERYEWTVGLGVRALNHIHIDWSYIHAPEGAWRNHLRLFDKDKRGASGARHGQWRISVTASRLFCWRRNDFLPLNLEKHPTFPLMPEHAAPEHRSE